MTLSIHSQAVVVLCWRRHCRLPPCKSPDRAVGAALNHELLSTSVKLLLLRHAAVVGETVRYDIILLCCALVLFFI